MRTTIFGLLFIGLCVGACGPGDPTRDTLGDESLPDLGSPDSAAEVDDCEGLYCTGPLGIGSCIEGHCGGMLGPCQWGPGNTCDSLCASNYRLCDENGREGATAWTWLGGSVEEVAELCAFADIPTAAPLDVQCDEDLEGVATYVSCCCIAP